MPIDPATIDAMVAAGFTAEQMAVVLKSELMAERATVIAADEARKARARDGNRERKARQRARGAEVTDVTHGHGVTHRDGVTGAKPSPTSFSESEQVPPSPPKGGSVPQGTRPDRKVRSRALPADWRPGDRSERVRVELGRSADWMIATATDMRVWAESKGEVRSDWDATHDGWMRREAKRECERPAARAGPVGNGSAGRAGYLDLARQAHLDLTEGDDGSDPFPDDAAARPAGGEPRDQDAGAPVRQPPGADLRLPPPRHPGPPRPH